MQKIFITGTNGFIGSVLVDKLVDRGFAVRGLVRREMEPKENVEYVSGDIMDVDSLRRGMEGCRYVFHLAAYAKNWAPDPKTFDRINIDGTRNVFAVAKEMNVDRIVWTSTIVTLGPTPPGVVGDESMPRITENFFTDYERTKTEMERESVRWVEEGLPLVIVNPTRVFGPGLVSESNTVTQLIDGYRRGRMPVLFNLGKNVGNYVLVDDVAEGHVLALEKGKIGERYILGGDNVSLKELFRTIDRIDGRGQIQIPLLKFGPLVAANVLELCAKLFGIYPAFTPGWIRTFSTDWAFTPEKAQRELGYRRTTFEDGVRATCAWLDEQKQDAVKTT